MRSRRYPMNARAGATTRAPATAIRAMIDQHLVAASSADPH